MTNASTDIDKSSINHNNNNKTKFTKHKLIILILLILSVIIVIIVAYIQYEKYESTDDAFIEGNVVQISPKVLGNVIHLYINDNQFVKKGDLLFEIDPKDYQTQVSKAKWQLQSAIDQYNGSKVNVGLTSITSKAGVKQAESVLDYSKIGILLANQQVLVSKNNILQADSQINQAKSLINQNKALVDSSNANLKLAMQDLTRYKSLYEQGAVSKQQYDTAVTNYQVATATLNENIQKVNSAYATLNSSKAAFNTSKEVLKQSKFQVNQAGATVGQSLGKLEQVNTVPQNIKISQSQFQAANAQIKQYAANLKQAELNLSYTKVYAPISGRIARRTVEKGAYFQAGQAALAIVPENVWVIANFKETQLTNMKPGQSAEIKVDSFPHKIFKGYVDSIQLGTGSRFSLFPPENAVGSYVKVVQRVPVKIVFKDKQSKKYLLAPGMSVEPKVKVK